MKGLHMPRYWTTPTVDPYEQISWETRSAVITDANDQVVFEQKEIEAPLQWSQLALNVVASKYFRGPAGSEDREGSVRHLVKRVVDTVTCWAGEGCYFTTQEDLDAFRGELAFLLLNQLASFNSPVWFNVGVEERPQCSACFINSVEDTMESILDLTKTEGLLFKYGSGTGTNFSNLRGCSERLSGGGHASGPVSFMKGYDAFAGVIKSGGKNRRSAKMVILDVDHPDIVKFIRSKAGEEKKAWTLIDAGYGGGVGEEAYGSVFFQNANNSVRVTDEFMEAVGVDGTWSTSNRTDGALVVSRTAREIMREIADATHLCGDPGVQFDTTINRWHTCKATDRIYASNPCSEYMFLNDSACNLASLNLMKFRDSQGEFNTEAFKHAIDVMLTAQEVLVSNSSYPNPKICENSEAYRPLGLGYANLGALLMARGLPYDSDQGRAYAASVTALMTGEAYAHSARMAAVKGPFTGFSANRNSMLDVVRDHRRALDDLDRHVPTGLLERTRDVWHRAVGLGEINGYRNAQVTALAPTGTISFMMDCDTTGIEPDISLVKYKKMAGGGMFRITNATVTAALERLGYTGGEAVNILKHLENEGTIEGAGLTDEQLAVFDCALRPEKGKRCISPTGHVGMVAAVQPFLSGAVSKTVNVPEETTPEEIAAIYTEAWDLGLKAIAIYRDGSKRSQPLSTRKAPSADTRPARRRLPSERDAITHKFSIAGHEGYVTVGLHGDGAPGEIFVTMSKQGSTIAGLMDSLAISVSLALQYGVPLDVLCRKFTHTHYEPCGFTGNKEIPMAKSITDYLFRWMGKRFIPRDDTPDSDTTPALSGHACADCGSIMVRSGSCYGCPNCGSTSGCS